MDLPWTTSLTTPLELPINIKNFIKDYLINVFPNMNPIESFKLHHLMTVLFTFIFIKSGISDAEVYQFSQLILRNKRNVVAIINLLFPFQKKDFSSEEGIRSIDDIFSLRDPSIDVNGTDVSKFTYTDMQVNSCHRSIINGKEVATLKRFTINDVQDNLRLLMSTIDQTINTLYVNWRHIVPIAIDTYKTSELYKTTTTTTKINQPLDLYLGYIDLHRGLSWCKIYDTVSMVLFDNIKTFKWLMYDLRIRPNTIPGHTGIIQPLKFITSMLPSIDLLKSSNDYKQLSPLQQQEFSTFWSMLLRSNSNMMGNLYFFFSKYHTNAIKLIKTRKLIVPQVLQNVFDNYNDFYEISEDNSTYVTTQLINVAYGGMVNVPIVEVFQFISDQIKAFSSSWFYHAITSKQPQTITIDDANLAITITPKLYYNYAKALLIKRAFSYTQVPNTLPLHWHSLSQQEIELVHSRLQSNDSKWFNINQIIKRTYNITDPIELESATDAIYNHITTNLIDVIFESLIYAGLLTKFNLTTLDYITTADYDQVANMETSKVQLDDYANTSYYYLTGQSYKSVKSFTLDDENWTNTYAMNWVSQLNFYHKYINCRVIMITGGTGVGKSTQSPKLLLYSTKMIDYKPNGKIICTQPRITPTKNNAKMIAKQLGVPVRLETKTTDTKSTKSTTNTATDASNYIVQFKYQGFNYVDATVPSFIRIVTDGTFLEELVMSPFVTKTLPSRNVFMEPTDNNPITNDANTNSDFDNIATSVSNLVSVPSKPTPLTTFDDINLYDIAIIDESHEHNYNMDLILTLMRDAVLLNNDLKLVIVSATMEDDEVYYRRYYRDVNDNRSSPLSMFIATNQLDRACVDRRIHISEPFKNLQYHVEHYYLPKSVSDTINETNYTSIAIDKTIDLINNTATGHVLLFLTGQSEIDEATQIINSKTPPDVIAISYYGKMDEDEKKVVDDIKTQLPSYKKSKHDPNSTTPIINTATSYTRAIIIATNVAEASVTIDDLVYVIDPGYAKVDVYDPLTNLTKLIVTEISQSSAVQRAGRVGRLMNGYVYHLYDKTKLINNKTSFKMAESNITTSYIKLLKKRANDYDIVTPINNPNTATNITKIANEANTSTDVTVTSVLKNTSTWSSILYLQYCIHQQQDVGDFYTYSGNQDALDQSYPFVLNKIYRAYTGFDNHYICDDELRFFIIHPDENIFQRDLFFGSVIAITNSKRVSQEYYELLFNLNSFPYDKQASVTTNIERFNRDVINAQPTSVVSSSMAPGIIKCKFPKYSLFVQFATTRNIIKPINTSTLPRIIVNYNDQEADNEINGLQANYNDQLNIVTTGFSNYNAYHVTSQYSIVSNVPRLLDIALYDLNYIMFAYYSLILDNYADVIGMIWLIQDKKLNTIIGSIKNEYGSFITNHKYLKTWLSHPNQNSDLWFIYSHIYTNIKAFLETGGYYEQVQVTAAFVDKSQAFITKYNVQVNIIKDLEDDDDTTDTDTDEDDDVDVNIKSSKKADDAKSSAMGADVTSAQVSNPIVTIHESDIIKIITTSGLPNTQQNVGILSSFMIKYLQSILSYNKMAYLESNDAEELQETIANTALPIITRDTSEYGKVYEAYLLSNYFDVVIFDFDKYVGITHTFNIMSPRNIINLKLVFTLVNKKPNRYKPTPNYTEDTLTLPTTTYAILNYIIDNRGYVITRVPKDYIDRIDPSFLRQTKLQ